MTPFTPVTGMAAPLLRNDIDTDVIIRVERMAGTPRDGMGAYAFEAWRRRPDGAEDPAFVLNQPAYRGTPILLAGTNFGCGSSREAAVWALMGAGLRCVIAESFGDIFAGNCFQNGLLPVVLPGDLIRALAGRAITVDLDAQTIVTPSGTIPFLIEPMRRASLLAGLDDIGLTQQHAAAIDAYQAADRQARPWIWLPGTVVELRGIEPLTS